MAQDESSSSSIDAAVGARRDSFAHSEAEPPAWLTPFEPHPWLRNGHLQTLAGNFLPRPASALPTVAETVEVDPADGSRVLCHCHFQPEAARRACLTAILVHGLEGSSNSRYVQGIATLAFAAGLNVVRMNMRNCGDTDALTPTLYHSGRSADVGAVIAHFAARYGLARFALVGYSMGGNLVLKLAGEWGQDPRLAAVATVCPVVDLGVSADALHEPANRVYEWHFLRGLVRRLRRKAELFPAIYSLDGLGPIRSIREFDQKVVAPHCGFRSADDYYFRAASARVLNRIAVPTLILCAADDPFIRLTPETRASLLAHPRIRLVETRHGGHCAFLARKPAALHWAEQTVVGYLQSVAASALPSVPPCAASAPQLQ